MPWTKTARGMALGFVVAVLTLSGGLARADEHVIRLAYEEFAPYSTTGPDGHPRGFSIDLVKWLAAASGYEVSFVRSANPTESVAMVGDGRADTTALLALTPQRLEIGRATTPLGAFELRAFIREDHAATVPTDLSGLRIGVAGGSFAVAGAQQIPFAQLVLYPETDSLIVPLLTGEVDAVVSAGDSFLGRLREAGVERQIRALDPPLISSPYGYITAPVRPDILAAFNEAIATELVEAELSLLRERWFGRSRTIADEPVFWWIALAAAAAIAALGVAWRTVRRHKRYSERLLRQNKANDLLVAALDEITAAIVIFDRDMRPIHWNLGFVRSFPGLVPDLEAGNDLRTMMTQSYAEEMVRTNLDAADLEVAIDGVIERLLRDETEPRTVHGQNGKVYEARDFRLGAQHYASVRVDITRLQEQQDTIVAQSDRLERANDQLQTFAAIAAHDLRAPLNQQKALMGFIAEDLADAKITLPVDTLDHFSVLRGLSGRMSGLVQDLLIYAQADTGEQEREQIAPSERLRGIVTLAALRKGFEVSYPGDLPLIHINPTAFDTILRNLISNAVKHHDMPTGRVVVEGRQEAGAVVFTVQDDGPGIDEQFRDQIFEPFVRLGSKVEGSGLGLAYIRKILEGWGGSVAVTAAEPRGSLFTITIPQRPIVSALALAS